MTAAPHTGQIVESPPSAALAAPPDKAPDAPRQLTWHSEDDTATFAHALAAQLRAMQPVPNAFITLHGELGAGKTTLVRHLLRALGVAGRIKSPTYAVVEPYELPGLPVWHFDFYRFDDPREWEDAGFRDIFASPGLKLAEWPEKATALIPSSDIAIHIEAIDDAERKVTLHAPSATGRSLLQTISQSP